MFMKYKSSGVIISGLKETSKTIINQISYNKNISSKIKLNKFTREEQLIADNDYKYRAFLKENQSLNFFKFQKNNFSLGYRAEDLDAKPMKKNKYDNVKLSFGKEARKCLLNGIRTVSENVAITYGPLGKNVVIDTNESPIITKDGVTVAKHINLSKRRENIGCRLLSLIAGNTNEFAGDGTTTSTVLAGELSK